MARRAVLLVGHGTVSGAEDLPAFLLRIRHGRPADPAFVAEIRRRYALIGRSPLLETTERLAAALALDLALPVRVAMRFWDPLIPDVLRGLTGDGVEELAVVPVAPFSVGLYVDVVARALEGIEGPRPTLRPAAPYGSDPALVEAQASLIRAALASRDPASTLLVLSAHSLPLRVLASGDGYQREFEASARAIGAALGWPVRIVYQSQGEGLGEWLGPTLLDAFDEAKARGLRTVVVAPVGFLADHVETLYDLDVEARGQAEARGLEFVRVPALNDAPSLVLALAALARRAFGEGPG